MEPSFDENVAGTMYLEPQEFSANIGRMERLHSANDSGIGDLHGSHSSSRIGLSIPNDCYRVSDSDQETLPVTPRAFYPTTAQRLNGHAPVSTTQFSFPPLGAPTSNPLPNKCAPPSGRAKDDPNIYTAIDDASLLTFHGDLPSKPGGDAAPLVCSYRPTGSRPISTDSAQSKGRENRLYEPPRADRRAGEGRGRAQGAGKDRPLSGKCCLNGIFNLIAVTAFALALFQLLRSSMDRRHEQLVSDYQSLKVANEDLKKTQLRRENNFSEMLTERLRQLNDSAISDATKHDDSVSLMLFRLLINDSDLRKKLLDSFEGRIELLKAEIESKVDSAKKQLEQHGSQEVQQLRMHVSGLLPVNMSACEYNSESKGTGVAQLEHQTEAKDLTGKFVLRVFCTTDGGNETLLEYSNSSPNVYSCTCRGQRNGAVSRYCILHYWTCPYL